jgi:hypothetical protein
MVVRAPLTPANWKTLYLLLQLHSWSVWSVENNLTQQQHGRSCYRSNNKRQASAVGWCTVGSRNENCVGDESEMDRGATCRTAAFISHLEQTVMIPGSLFPSGLRILVPFTFLRLHTMAVLIKTCRTAPVYCYIHTWTPNEIIS